MSQKVFPNKITLKKTVTLTILSLFFKISMHYKFIFVYLPSLFKAEKKIKLKIDGFETTSILNLPTNILLAFLTS